MIESLSHLVKFFLDTVEFGYELLFFDLSLSPAGVGSF